MHPATHLSRAPRATSFAVVLGAMLCLASAGALAASPRPAVRPMFSNTPVKATAAPVAAAAPDDDDCDGDDVAPPRAAAVPSWDILPSDKTLKAALTRWAAAASWQLVWELPVDYAVDVRTGIKGSFIPAVETVARSMGTAETPMKAIFYEGNHVLRIVAK